MLCFDSVFVKLYLLFLFKKGLWKYSCKKLIAIKGAITKIGKTYKAFLIGKITKVIGFHMPAVRKICHNIVDYLHIRKNTGQRKPAFWHVLRSVSIMGCKGMLCQK